MNLNRYEHVDGDFGGGYDQADYDTGVEHDWGRCRLFPTADWFDTITRWPQLLDGCPGWFHTWFDLDGDGRPVGGVAIRDIPSMLYPDGGGDDWWYGCDDTVITWDGDQPTVKWAGPDLTLHQLADRYTERLPGLPISRPKALWHPEP